MSNDSIKYKGYTIEIHQDDMASNPFTEWDCEPDIIVSGRDYFEAYGAYDYKYLPDLTEAEIKAGTEDILEDILEGILEETDSHTLDAVNEALQEYYEGLYLSSDKLHFMAFILALKGAVVLDTCVTGYSQGDYVDILVIAGPEFLKRTGAEITKPEQLQSTADLYGSWAFGDVYFYSIEDLDGETDTCGDFYGSDHDKSGLLENAKNAIDAHLDSAENVITPDMKKVYLDNPNTCPYCGSEDLETSNMQIDTSYAYQEITCDKCGKEWRDIYHLTDVEVIN